jgi:hypothetical protein
MRSLAEYNDLKRRTQRSQGGRKTKINNAMTRLKNKAQMTDEQIRRKMDESARRIGGESEQD